MTALTELNQNILNQVAKLGLTGFRQEALNQFKQCGLPHKKLEDYKYTDVSEHFNKELKLAPASSDFDRDELREKANLGTANLVFINGNLVTEFNKLPNGVQLEHSMKVPSLTDFPSDSLENLNLALTKKIFKLTIDKNVSVAESFNIIHFSNKSSENLVSSSRLLIDVAENSSIDIFESFISSDGIILNRGHLTQLVCHRNSNVLHVKAVNEGNSSFHFSSFKAVVKKAANLNSFTFSIGGKLIRNNISIELVEPEARALVNGLYALKGKQHCDNFCHIHHRAERTESEQLFKAVLDDLSHGIFTGKIVVHRDAQLVSSSQLNKNLLLSKKAHADTRPQLEVYADDVKCAHGATVGQLSEEELFYLESRAISPRDARVMLCHGFVQEALDTITNDKTKKILEELLYKDYEKDIHEKIKGED